MTHVMSQANAGTTATLGLLAALAGCATEAGVPVARVFTPEGANHQASAYSPDGTRIAYLELGAEGWDLWVASADFTDPMRIATTGELVLPLSWSPDGRWIAFGSNAASLLDVWVVAADGGEPRRLTDGAGLEFPGPWHPDSDRLVYFATAEGGQIGCRVLDVATGATAPFVRAEPNACGWWSPDGSAIAYLVQRGDVATIGVADADGENPRQLTTEGYEYIGDQYSPWSPDGSELLYVSRRTGTADVWVLPVHGGAPRQLTRDVRNDYAPVWSPDGQWVAFLSERGRQTDVWVVPAAGGTELRVTNDAAEEDFLQWHPAGDAVAFHTGLLTSAIWAVSLDDGSERRLTPESERAVSPAVSPAGTEVLYRVLRGGGVSDLHIAPLEGGPARVLTAGAGENSGAQWSPDGSKVVFTSDRAGGNDIWVIDGAGGDPVRLTDWQTTEASAAWSMDGASIYFLSDRDADPIGDLWMVPATGGEAQRVTRVGTIVSVVASRSRDEVFVGHVGGSAGQLAVSRLSTGGSLETLWDRTSVLQFSHHAVSPSGDMLALPVEVEGQVGAMLLPTAGGPAQQILDGYELAFPEAWSPDGMYLAYEFAAAAEGPLQADLGLYSPSDGTRRRLTSTPEEEVEARWTPDGSTLVFSRSDAKRKVARVSVAGLIGR